MIETTVQRAVPLLFFKAVTKKKVWIPGYTKRNGTVVLGHYATVNVSVDHDEQKVVAGNGSFSQKEAHKKLSKEDWFHELPHDHKHAVLLKEATKIQQAASVAAQGSKFRKKILAGTQPGPAEWKAYDSLPADKKKVLDDEIAAAGKKSLDVFAAGYAGFLAANPPTEATAPVTPASFEAPAPTVVAAAPIEPEAVEPAEDVTKMTGYRSDAQVAAAKKRAAEARQVDPERDSLLTAIAKLGGIKRADAKSQFGYGDNDMKGVRVGIKPVFSHKGLSLERMGEALHELGYLTGDEHGRFDGRELEEHISNSLGGAHHFTPQGYAHKAEKDYTEQYQELTSQDAAESGFDDLPAEAQSLIEEQQDEYQGFSADDYAYYASLGSMGSMAGTPSQEQLDFGAEGTGHGSFDQADDAARGTQESAVVREPGQDDDEPRSVGSDFGDAPTFRIPAPPSEATAPQVSESATPEKPMKNYGWDSVKLSDAYSLKELEKLRQQVTAQHANPRNAEGRYLENGHPTLYLYDKKGRQKLEKIAMAVYHKTKDGHKDGSVEKSLSLGGPSRKVIAAACVETFMKAARPDGWKEPTAAQAAAGNYQKPRVKWNGLDIAIENPAGSTRKGDGWQTTMKHDYGYVCGSQGVDGDGVDVYLGPALDAATSVYVVHQRQAGDWDTYDEDKAMIGFASQDEARAAYLQHYDDPRFLGPITAMPVDEFVSKVRATKGNPAMIKCLFIKSAKLSESMRESIGTEGSKHREDMPADAFLEGAEKKYPIKTKEGDKWVYSPKLLEAAAARARMQGRDDLAKRADDIRAKL